MKITMIQAGIIPLMLISLVLGLYGDEPVELRFIQKEGQVLHGDSLVDERVYMDGYLSHHAEIDEFSVSSVRSVDTNGRAVLDSSFRTVERIGGFPGYYQWNSSETVRLERASSGEMAVPHDAARPVLRNVPTFPDSPVEPGDSWSLPAEEVHVLRINGRLYGPYRSTAQVFYQYRENRKIGESSMAVIDLEYNLYLPVRQAGEPIRLITGQSRQEILWNIDEGRPERREENFEFLMMMSDGRSQEFIGTGITTYRLTESLNRQETVDVLQSELQNVPGISVSPMDDGILLSVTEEESILFEPESAIVRITEQYRLEKLSSILDKYRDRDILITGHTADYGTAEGRSRLSFERASSVAGILFPRGREGEGRLFLRGAGNSEPAGTDRENRRVEILILD